MDTKILNFLKSSIFDKNNKKFFRKVRGFLGDILNIPLKNEQIEYSQINYQIGKILNLVYGVSVYESDSEEFYP